MESPNATEDIFTNIGESSLLVTRPKPYMCARCKGSRRLCGLPACHILLRLKEQAGIFEKLKEARDIAAPSPPSLLVGEKGYPYVRVGVNLAEGDNAPLFEDPGSWWGRLGLLDIIKLRASMIYSYRVLRVRSASNRIAEAVQEAAMSIRPVESEVFLSRPPVFTMRFDPLVKPVGFSAEVEKISLTSNPVIPRRVDSLVADRVKAREALIELYSRGFDVYYLQRLLSSGALGVDKKFVPTRWSITAVDRAIGDYLLSKVKTFPEISGVEVYTSSYIGNNYVLLFLPGPWFMEMVEIWLPNSVWVPGAEPYTTLIHEYSDGRPSGQDGGYDAIRLPVLENLYKRGRQARVLAIREVTPEYFAPVGNWQIRESVRAALGRPPERYESLREALEAIKTRLKTPLEVALRRSTFINVATRQKTLMEFLG
ncbi:MAG: Nre family DNA repair protein [Thermofilum sp.]